jgi:hypothetical protein
MFGFIAQNELPGHNCEAGTVEDHVGGVNA